MPDIPPWVITPNPSANYLQAFSQGAQAGQAEANRQLQAQEMAQRAAAEEARARATQQYQMLNMANAIARQMAAEREAAALQRYRESTLKQREQEAKAMADYRQGVLKQGEAKAEDLAAYREGMLKLGGVKAEDLAAYRDAMVRLGGMKAEDLAAYREGMLRLGESNADAMMGYRDRMASVAETNAATRASWNTGTGTNGLVIAYDPNSDSFFYMNRNGPHQITVPPVKEGTLTQVEQSRRDRLMERRKEAAKGYNAAAILFRNPEATPQDKQAFINLTNLINQIDMDIKQIEDDAEQRSEGRKRQPPTSLVPPVLPGQTNAPAATNRVARTPPPRRPVNALPLPLDGSALTPGQIYVHPLSGKLLVATSATGLSDFTP